MQSLDQVQEYFKSRRPWLRRMIYRTFAGRVADMGEVMQNVETLAWLGVMRLHTVGKWHPDRLKACLLFAIGQHRAGRTITVHRGRRPLRLADIDVAEIMGHDDPIPQVVQTKVDWEAYLETLSERWRGFAADCLEVGPDNPELARRWGVGESRACQIRRQIRDGYVAFLKNAAP